MILKSIIFFQDHEKKKSKFLRVRGKHKNQGPLSFLKIKNHLFLTAPLSTVPPPVSVGKAVQPTP